MAVYVLASFLATFALTFLFMKYAIYKGVIDVPNHRSSHSTPTPRGAGIAIVIVFFTLVSFLSSSLQIASIYTISLLLGACTVAAVGFWDDHKHVPARWRFLTHFVAALISLLIIPSLPGLPLFGEVIDLSVFGYLFYGFTLVWLLNLYNFMDGIDGIASLQAISMLLSAAFIIGDHSWSWLLILLAASVAGFLYWNWAPAKVFMGDACSGCLGFSLGLIAIITAADELICIWSWLILYSVFVVDATITLFRRIYFGEVWYEAHCCHAYQILARNYNSHKLVSTGVFAVNLLWLLPIAWLADVFPEVGLILTLIAIAPITILCFWIGAGESEISGLAQAE
ncbi:MAG: glycosyl transferase [Gammaproteobacteria bacterium]|nr:MAG: glycosyl transferase [Gammaproteobacteria bacterium]